MFNSKNVFWRKDLSKVNSILKELVYIYSVVFYNEYTGAGEPGGSGGVGPPLELEIYLIKILEIRKKKFFLVSDPP